MKKRLAMDWSELLSLFAEIWPKNGTIGYAYLNGLIAQVWQGKNSGFKVTAHSNNRNSKSTREVILGSVRLWQSVILRNYDMFSTDCNARYTARW